MAQWISRLERHAFPEIGRMPVHAIGQADLLRVLEPLWLTKPETARRIRQRMALVFDWARTAGHSSGVNPVEGVEAGLPRQRDKVQHHAALPWRDLPGLWPRLEAVEGVGAPALRFAILTAARSGEVRGATWDEIDLEAALWTIPAGRMKSGREHRVPLPGPALEILLAVRGLDSRLVFPSRSAGRPLSDATLAAVLKRLRVDAVPHGFRSTFRDWAEEAVSYSHEVKEAALAHAVKSRVEAAYRRGDLLEQRRPLMDTWARYVAGGGAVVRLEAAR